MEKDLLQARFNQMCATGKLFRSTVTGSQLWDAYLKGFGEDPIFRDPQSSVHNCNQCKHFFNRYGNIVAVDENNRIMTMFDTAPDEYKESFRLMSELLKNAPIQEVFVETYQYLYNAIYEHCSKTADTFALNLDHNVKRYTKEEAEMYGVVKAGETRTFSHFSVRLPKQFVDFSMKSVSEIAGTSREDKAVFKRALDEIPADTLKLVLDLISQGSLLNGDTFKAKVQSFLELADEYACVPTEQRDNWCWVKSYKNPIARFRNELIGTLCVELAEGKELNAACLAFNKRVDPANYMKAKAPITQRMIDNAKEFIAENGYEESFTRRCATMEDIRVCDILHANAGDGTVKAVSILDGIKPTSTRHKRSEFDGVEEVPIDKELSAKRDTVEVLVKHSLINGVNVSPKDSIDWMGLATAIRETPDIFKSGSNRLYVFEEQQSEFAKWKWQFSGKSIDIIGRKWDRVFNTQGNEYFERLPILF